MKRTIVPAALLCAALSMSSAFAEEELLVRSAISFHECQAAISAMLEKLGANQNNARTISDTGAHYFVELESTQANLQFRCNAVTEQIEVARISPGTLNKLASE